MYSKCAICNLNVTVCYREYIKHKPMAKVDENSHFFFLCVLSSSGCCCAFLTLMPFHFSMFTEGLFFFNSS